MLLTRCLHSIQAYCTVWLNIKILDQQSQATNKNIFLSNYIFKLRLRNKLLLGFAKQKTKFRRAIIFPITMHRRRGAKVATGQEKSGMYECMNVLFGANLVGLYPVHE